MVAETSKVKYWELARLTRHRVKGREYFTDYLGRMS